MTKVNIPYVGVVEFPKDMSPEAITATIQKDILPNAPRPEAKGLETLVPNTKVADFLANYVAKPAQALANALPVTINPYKQFTKEEEPKERPLLAASAKGILGFSELPAEYKLSTLLENQAADKATYGFNYENAPPEKMARIKERDIDINNYLYQQQQNKKTKDLITEKYGENLITKKLNALEKTPEFKNADTLAQLSAIGGELIRNPKEIPEYIASIGLESLPSSISMAASGIAARFGFKSNAAAMTAGGATSAFTEFGQNYNQLREQGFQHKDAWEMAGVKSAIIGIFDAASFGSAGTAAGKVIKGIETGAIKATAKELAKETGKQAGFGMAGEGLGSFIGKQEVNPRQIIEEGIGEVFGAPLDAVSTYRKNVEEQQGLAALKKQAEQPITPTGKPTFGAIKETDVETEPPLTTPVGGAALPPSIQPSAPTVEDLLAIPPTVPPVTGGEVIPPTVGGVTPETQPEVIQPIGGPSAPAVIKDGKTVIPVFDDNGITNETDVIDLNPETIFFDDGQVWAVGENADHPIDNVINLLPESPEKQTLIETASKLREENKPQEVLESEPFVTNNRVVVLKDINGVKVPFYISTGRGGKTNVATGQWYPYFGNGPKDGWFNKGSEEDINNFYNVPELKAAADELNERIGDIRDQMGNLPTAKALGIDPNQDMMPVDYDEGEKAAENIYQILEKIKAEKAEEPLPPAGVAEPVEEPIYTLKDIIDNGQEVTSREDAESRHANGEILYGFHDQDTDKPILLKDIEQIANFTPDQILAMPKKEPKEKVLPKLPAGKYNLRDKFQYEGRTWQINSILHTGKSLEANTVDKGKFLRQRFEIEVKKTTTEEKPTGGPSAPAGKPLEEPKEEKPKKPAKVEPTEEEKKAIEEEKAKKEEEKKAADEKKKKAEEQKKKVEEFNTNPMKVAMETGNADEVAALLYGHAVDENLLPVIFPEEMLLRIPVELSFLSKIEEQLTANKFRITDRSVPATTDDPAYTGPERITISALFNPERITIEGGGAEFVKNRKGQITAAPLPKDATDAQITKMLDLASKDKIFDIQSNPDNTFGAMMFKEGLIDKVMSAGDYLYEIISLPTRKGGRFNIYIPPKAGKRQVIKLALAEGKEDLIKEVLTEYVNTLEQLQTVFTENSNVAPLFNALQTKYIKDEQLTGAEKYTPDGLNLRTKITENNMSIYLNTLFSLFNLNENSTDQTNRIVKKDAESPPELGNIIRRGMRDHRQGRDVDVQDFLETFKFFPGGIDFGNWVNQTERAAHLNAIYDAMYDLADIAGISPHMLGLGQKLKLAVGAQGRGGKTAAWYFPSLNEINLTKTKGDGSLGHEWQHGLDWNLKQTPNGKLLMTDTGAALQKIITVDKVENNLRDILTNTSNSENNRNIPPKKAFFNAISNRRYHEADIYDDSFVYTQYFKDAYALDQGRDPKYWSTPVEMLSRAFESLIFDLSKGGSPYLVGPTVADGYVSKKNGYAGTSYPAGKERAQINEIYQQMLDQIDPDTLEVKTYKLENQIIYVEDLGYAVVDQFYIDRGQAGGLNWFKTEAEAQQAKEERDGREEILTPRLIQISKVNQHIINMAQRIDAIMEEMGLFKWPEIKNGSMAESMFYHMRQGWWPKNNRELAEYGIKAYLQSPELLGFNPAKDQKQIDSYKIADFEGDRIKLKQTQEDFEAAATRFVSQVITDMRAEGSDTKAIYDYIVNLYQNQPVLDVQTILSKTNNAYSTPLPIGFIAGMLSRVKSTTTVLDPTGGNGMLVVTANPKNVTTIEKDEHRVNNLQLMQMGDVIEGDVLVKIKDIQDQQVDVVLANPPFGSLPSPVDVMSWTGQPYKIGALDQLIAAESLRTMANNGRAFLILGSHPKLNTITSTDKIFLNWLYGNYNVADHFEIAGNLYRKQGASFPLRVLVIAGRNQTDNVYPNDFAVNRLTSFDELWSRYVQASDRSEQVVVGTGKTRKPTGGADTTTGRVPTSDSFEDVETSGGVGTGTGAGIGEPVSPTGGVNIPPKSGGRGTAGGVRDTEQQQDSGEGQRGGSGSGAAGTTGRGEVSSGESGDELGGLSDLDLDDIFDNLGKKPKTGTTTPKGEPKVVSGPRAPKGQKVRVKTVIPKELEGLGLESLLDDLDAALNGKAPEVTNKEPTLEDSQERLDKQSQEAMDRIAQNTKNTSNDPNSGLYSRKGDQDYANVQPIIQKVWEAVGQKIKDTKERINKVYDLLVSKFGDLIKVHLRQYINGLRTTVKRRPKNQTPVQSEPIDTESRVVYLGKSRFASDGIYLPRAQSQHAYTALENLEAQVGNIDEFVAQELGYSSVDQMAKGLAGYQIDALALAIQANKLGKGFIIGDDTGVGKGRTAAAMIVWAKKQGKVPVFVTLSDSLYTAMYADLINIGHGDIKVAMTNTDSEIIKDIGEGKTQSVFKNKEGDSKKLVEYITKNKKLPPGKDVLFTTYSQLNGGTGSPPRQSAIASLVASGDAVLIMDEAHNAAGSPADKESTGQNAFFMSLLTGKDLLGKGQDAPDDWQPPPTVYLSATFAKRPDNMPLYIHTNLRYAADTPEDLTALFGKGVRTDVLQQVSSEMLVESGSMIRRERSYEGVTMDFVIDDKNTARDTREVDKVTEILRALVNADRALKEWMKTPAGQAEIVKLGPPGSYIGKVGPTAFNQVKANAFTSVVHNYIGSLLLSTKTQTAVDMVVEKLNNNEKVVVGLQNTNGSALEDFVTQNNIKKGDDIPDFGWQTLIKRAVNSTKKVTLKSATGDKSMDKVVYIPNDVMPPSIRAGYNNVENALINFQSDLPAAPIDYIRTELEQKYVWTIDGKVHVGDTPPKGVKARHLVVKEITGRKSGIDYSGDIPKYITLDNPERTSMISSFQNGDESKTGPIDVLIINSAGATGISLHASVDAFDQRPRHMIVLQPHGDISVFIQLLGRIHRTGQVEWPSFTMLATGIPAERRILAMLRKKLSSLKSNTSGGSSSTKVDGVDFINMYGDVSTAEYLNEHPDIQAFLNVTQYPDPAEAAGTDLAHTASGTAGLLSSVDQKEFFDSIEASYIAEIDLRNATGTNALERRVLPLEAEIIKENLIEEGLDSTNPFLTDVVMAQFNVDIIGSIPTVQNIKDDIALALNGRTAQDVVNEIETDLSTVYIEVRNQIVLKQQALDEAIKNPAATEKDIAELNKQKTALDTQFATLNDRKEKTLSALKNVYAIGNGFESFEVNNVPAAAVVIGLKVDKARIGKSKTGNPYSPSNFQVIIKRNIPEGRVSPTLATLEGSSIQQSGPWRNPPLDEWFALKSVTGGRTTRYIALGNILKAAQLFGPNGGEIAKFTLNNTKEAISGVVMPAKYVPVAISEQPIRLRNQESAAQYLLAVWDAILQKRYDTSQVELYKDLSNSLQPLMIPNLPSFADKAEARPSNAVILRGSAQTWELRIDPYTPDNFKVTIAGDVPKKFVTNPILKTLIPGPDLAKKGKGKWEMGPGYSLKDPEKLIKLIKFLHKNFPATVEADNAPFAREVMKVEFDNSETKKGLASRTVAEGGQSVEAVQAQVVPVKGITVNVLQSVDELPDNTAPSDVEGMWISGRTVYLIADNLPNAKRVQQVLAHEAIGHALLEEMLGPELMAVLIKNIQNLEKTSSLVKGIAARVDQTQPGLSPERRAKEIVANMAERGMYKTGLIQRVIQAIRNWLRSQGLTISFSDGDIVELLSAAEQYVGRTEPVNFPSLQTAQVKTQAEINRERQEQKRAGTAGYFSRVSGDENYRRKRAKHNRVKNTPTNQSPTVQDMLTGGKQALDELRKDPIAPINNMTSNAERALVNFRNKATFFGTGLKLADIKKYGGQLVNSIGQATSYVSLINAIHAGHIATEVIARGALEFNEATQMFQAVRRNFGMANVMREKSKLVKKIGLQDATNMINDYLEAARSQSILNEYETAENRIQELQDELLTVVDEKYLETLAKLETAKAHLEDVFRARVKVRFSQEAIDDFLEMENDYPELRAILDNWTKVNQNMLDMAAFSGYLGQERVDRLKEIKDYVPWQRIMEEDDDIHSVSRQPATQTAVRGLTNIAKLQEFREVPKVKRAKAKFDAGEITQAELDQVIADYVETLPEIDDIIDNMLNNIAMMTRNSIKNYAANRITAEYAVRSPNGKIVRYQSEKQDRTGVKYNVRINGKKSIVKIEDPLIAESVLGLENIFIPMNDILAITSNILRRSITFSGYFQLKQAFKDAPAAAWISGVKNPFALWAKAYAGFVQALLPNDPIVDMLKSYGIGGYQSVARSPQKELQIKLGLIDDKIWAKTLNLIDKVGDASDYSQRIGVYKQVLKETNNPMQALIQSNDVIDFLKKGSSAKAQFLARNVSFMNAYAVSIDVLAETLRGGGVKGKTREELFNQMLKTGALLAGTTMIYCMLVGDDDEYNKLDDQTKLRNIYIPGLNIKIPMNTSASFFFKSVPEMLYNYVTKDGTKNEVDNRRLRTALMTAAMDAFLGPTPIPSGALPFVEIGLDYSFFTGSTVTPKGLEGLIPAQQYNEKTSELGKIISALTSIPLTDNRMLSPIQADHIVRGLFGSAGVIAMYGSNIFNGDRVTPQDKDNPLYGGFVMADVKRGREDLFYDLKSKTDTAYKTFQNLHGPTRQEHERAEKFLKENQKLIEMHGYTQGVGASLAEINRIIRMYGESKQTGTPDERRQKILEFQQTKENILKDVIERRKQAGF